MEKMLLVVLNDGETYSAADGARVCLVDAGADLDKDTIREAYDRGRPVSVLGDLETPGPFTPWGIGAMRPLDPDGEGYDCEIDVVCDADDGVDEPLGVATFAGGSPWTRMFAETACVCVNACSGINPGSPSRVALALGDVLDSLRWMLEGFAPEEHPNINRARTALILATGRDEYDVPVDVRPAKLLCALESLEPVTERRGARVNGIPEGVLTAANILVQGLEQGDCDVEDYARALRIELENAGVWDEGEPPDGPEVRPEGWPHSLMPPPSQKGGAK